MNRMTFVKNDAFAKDTGYNEIKRNAKTHIE